MEPHFAFFTSMFVCFSFDANFSSENYVRSVGKIKFKLHVWHIWIFTLSSFSAAGVLCVRMCVCVLRSQFGIHIVTEIGIQVLIFIYLVIYMGHFNFILQLRLVFFLLPFRTSLTLCTKIKVRLHGRLLRARWRRCLQHGVYQIRGMFASSISI